jgi:putative methyltransferase (TIGR04325 family)
MPKAFRMGSASRRLLRATLPPVLIDALQKQRRRYYSTFAEAKAASSGTWQNEKLTQFRLEEALQNLPTLESSALPQGYALLLATVALMTLPKPRICDLGGGCGAWGYRLGKDTPHPFEYTVVEHEGLVAACGTHPFFSWAAWQNELPSECDVLVCSGTLQYLEQPYDLLRDALTRTQRHVVIARTSFSERDFVQVQVSTLQNNGHAPTRSTRDEPTQHTYYPHRTVRLSKILAIAEAAGFDVQLKLHPVANSIAPGAFDQDMVLTRRVT